MRGFTLIETLVAIFILSVGLMGVAALISQMTAKTTESRYVGMANMLASEKLEDLNRFSTRDPNICVPTGSATAGDLTSSSADQAVTCPDLPGTPPTPGNTGTVDYADTVRVSVGGGSISETYNDKDPVSGNAGYTTLTQTPDGSKPASTWNASAPAPSADTLLFNRRWIIEQDQPVPGVRRVTVRVTLQAPIVQGAQPVQMSMVRP